MSTTRLERVLCILPVVLCVAALWLAFPPEDSGGYIVAKPLHEVSGGLMAMGEDDYRLNINVAGARELSYLPGIGDTLAERIVEYRDQFGPFAQTEDIMLVDGIGEKKYSQIEELITVGD